MVELYQLGGIIIVPDLVNTVSGSVFSCEAPPPPLPHLVALNDKQGVLGDYSNGELSQDDMQFLESIMVNTTKVHVILSFVLG